MSVDLRGAAIDKLNAQVLAEMNRKTVETALDGVKEMTLTMVDGDFPREVLAGQNLKFTDYRMPSRRNSAQNYDATSKRAGGKKEGVLILGKFEVEELEELQARRANSQRLAWPVAAGSLLLIGLWFVRRNRRP